MMVEAPKNAPDPKAPPDGRQFIVAEISKNWPEWQAADSDLPRFLSERFEMVINTNRERGYKLHSWQLNRIETRDENNNRHNNTLNETIVAVFEKADRNK